MPLFRRPPPPPPCPPAKEKSGTEEHQKLQQSRQQDNWHSIIPIKNLLLAPSSPLPLPDHPPPVSQ